jgi:hypothetical protein
MSSTKSKLTLEDKKKLAASLFNLVWDLMEKSGRTVEDDEKMLNAAHASRYFWGEVGTPINFTRGEWQLSRVYSLLSRSEPAVHHAENSLRYCQNNSIGDFDLAFAYEALARSFRISHDKSQFDRYYRLAEESGEKIFEKEDKEYFFKELGTIKSS